jgi:hypothetical protein
MLDYKIDLQPIHYLVGSNFAFLPPDIVVCAPLHPVDVDGVDAAVLVSVEVFSAVAFTCDWSVVFALWIAHSSFGILSFRRHVGDLCPPFPQQ